MDRAGAEAQDGLARWHGRDQRTSHRIAVKGLSMKVALQPATTSQAAITTRLVNVSGGGCCLTAAARDVAGLTPDLQCTVDLPTTPWGVSQPATLLGIEPKRAAPGEVLLRLRFRKAAPQTQRHVTRWIGELAIQTWHSQQAVGDRR